MKNWKRKGMFDVALLEKAEQWIDEQQLSKM
jgi:hypothetical protein